MNPFTFVCTIVVASILGGCYKATLKHRSSGVGSEIKDALTRMSNRLDSIERRTSDLETLVIEKEKELKYDRL